MFILWFLFSTKVSNPIRESQNETTITRRKTGKASFKPYKGKSKSNIIRLNITNSMVSNPIRESQNISNLDVM